MKSAFLLITCSLCFYLQGQVAINNTNTPAAGSAQLDVSSTTKGTLLTRMTTAQRKAIAGPAIGLLVYDLDKQCLYLYDGSNWNPLAFTNDGQLPAVSRSIPDYFGGLNGVSVDIDGSYAVVGVTDAGNAGISYCGAVYVFQLVNGAWAMVQKLVAADAYDNLNMGKKIAIKGNYIITSAPYTDVAGTTSAGAVYVFKNTGGTWAQFQKITRPTPVANDCFGYSVDIDGSNIAISAMDDFSGQGDAYVYQLSGSSFVLAATLIPTGLTATERYGSCIAIASDKIVVGAPYNTYASKTQAGACYAFRLNAGSWNYLYKIIPADGATNDHFGASIALNYDPFNLTELFVGAPDKTYLTYTNAGKVYGFLVTNSSVLAGPSSASPSAKSDTHFGNFISYRQNKLTVAESAISGTKGNVFVYDASFNTSISNAQKLVFVSNPETSVYNSCGVAISGNNIIIGFLTDNKIYFKNIE